MSKRWTGSDGSAPPSYQIREGKSDRILALEAARRFNSSWSSLPKAVAAASFSIAEIEGMKQKDRLATAKPSKSTRFDSTMNRFPGGTVHHRCDGRFFCSC